MELEIISKHPYLMGDQDCGQAVWFTVLTLSFFI